MFLQLDCFLHGSNGNLFFFFILFLFFSKKLHGSLPQPAFEFKALITGTRANTRKSFTPHQYLFLFPPRNVVQVFDFIYTYTLFIKSVLAPSAKRLVRKHLKTRINMNLSQRAFLRSKEVYHSLFWHKVSLVSAPGPRIFGNLVTCTIWLMPSLLYKSVCVPAIYNKYIAWRILPFLFV